MLICGVTGPSGSGKGYLCEMLEAPDIYIIDTDSVYHKLTAESGECTRAIENRFGSSVINTDGSLNRAKLAEIVFNERGMLGVLNDITHPIIAKKCNEIIAMKQKEGYKAVIIDAPLLFESGLNSICDFVIAVIADEEVRIKRIMERDSITREKAELRITNQHKNEFYTEQADIIVTNNSNEIETQAIKIRKIINENGGN